MVSQYYRKSGAVDCKGTNVEFRLAWNKLLRRKHIHYFDNTEYKFQKEEKCSLYIAAFVPRFVTQYLRVYIS